MGISKRICSGRGRQPGAAGRLGQMRWGWMGESCKEVTTQPQKLTEASEIKGLPSNTTSPSHSITDRGVGTEATLTPFRKPRFFHLRLRRQRARSTMRVHCKIMRRDNAVILHPRPGLSRSRSRTRAARSSASCTCTCRFCVCCSRNQFPLNPTINVSGISCS